MPSTVWSESDAEHYDAGVAAMAEPAVVGATVDVLAELAGDGAAVEFAVGTGRVALPLRARGVRVAGIELSPHMVEQLRRKPGGDQVDVVVGDMATVRVPGGFSLAYLVFNTIMNVTTQDEQAAVFANAAAHLEPGGAFVVEVGMPLPTLLAPGQTRHVYELGEAHTGIDTLDDPVAQLSSSHHFSRVDGSYRLSSLQFRYAWPSELDLMARLAGMRLESRWAGWDRSPFTARSPGHVSVWRLAPS